MLGRAGEPSPVTPRLLKRVYQLNHHVDVSLFLPFYITLYLPTFHLFIMVNIQGRFKIQKLEEYSEKEFIFTILTCFLTYISWR